MLIDFSETIKKHELNIRGVIHVGAHYGEEHPVYQANGVSNVIYVEPCTPAFSVLKDKFYRDRSVLLFNCALGDNPGWAEMHIETRNNGQSNSLLAPKKHLAHYSDIVFEDKERVEVRTLDSLPFDRNDYNCINMDVQGFEKFVLRGGLETLKHIDVVYTEVNTDYLYEGNTLMGELDSILKDFERVETKLTTHAWGDAVYVRIKPRNMVRVPEKFRPHHVNPYPPDNHMIFEEWFYKQFESSDGRIYLPVFWTSYYVNHGHGKDKFAIDELQQFLWSLDRTKKYFTIVQYDDGILNDISHLDIKVFAMCGNRIDYPLPLLCPPHEFSFSNKRDLFANFIGAETHQIRSIMLKTLMGLPSYYLSTGIHPLHDYCNVLSRSVFTLAPRGYGITSFRIAEAVQYGSIPVYISDQFVIPHDIPFNRYGVIIHASQIGSIHEILSAIPQNVIEEKQESLKHASFLFSYEYNKNVIETECQFL